MKHLFFAIFFLLMTFPSRGQVIQPVEREVFLEDDGNSIVRPDQVTLTFFTTYMSGNKTTLKILPVDGERPRYGRSAGNEVARSDVYAKGESSNTCTIQIRVCSKTSEITGKVSVSTTKAGILEGKEFKFLQSWFIS